MSIQVVGDRNGPQITLPAHPLIILPASPTGTSLPNSTHLHFAARTVPEQYIPSQLQKLLKNLELHRRDGMVVPGIGLRPRNLPSERGMTGVSVLS